MKKLKFLLAVALAVVLPWLGVAAESAADWYEVETINRPFVRWWWHGSAVDSLGLSYNLGEFARQGLGGVEITPIYGVKGNEAHDIPYLSERWMQMLGHVTDESRRLGLQVEMNNGTGWPFGGPEVTAAESAQKQIVERWPLKGGTRLKAKIVPADSAQRRVASVERVMAVAGATRIDVSSHLTADTMLNWEAPRGNDWTIYSLFAGRTFQRVKRAAPGGEGFVVNHYDSVAVKKYLERFDRAFAGREDMFPAVVFNDSYEVYRADWTAGLFDNFFRDHGYRLEEYLPEFADETDGSDLRRRIVRDYRYTLGELLKKNFTEVWLRWAHSHGVQVRNQSHGSPANIIDLYAMVDIPECESFGRSNFDIPGLHPTGPSRHSDADPAVLKFASSAAHLAGRRYVSAEALTWLTEHFHTSLSLCKPELDQLFASGVNHVFFHGATYSPKDVAFPGWLFYASVNMSPTNIIWTHAAGLFDYIARCQAFLSAGTPDSDVLLYFPIDDLWRRQPGTYMMFDIHSMDRKMPHIKRAVADILTAGLDVDYLSDGLIDSLRVQPDGTLLSAGGNAYKAIVVPEVDYMPEATRKALQRLADAGATVTYDGALPDITPEPLRRQGVRMLRRRNEAGGWNYFLALLSNNPVDGWVELATPSQSVIIYDPLTATKGKAHSETSADGGTRLRLQMRPGETRLLKTLPYDVDEPTWAYYAPAGAPVAIDRGWSISFLESEPPVTGTFATDSLVPWTSLPVDEARINYGTARYHVEFDLPEIAVDEWLLDLGDLRECARVSVNGHDAGTVWCVPFTLSIGQYLRPGRNTLDIDVTNLQANRIADYDRRGVEWKIFKDANIASVAGGRRVDFSDWPMVPAGLNSAVTITPLTLYPKP